MKHTIVFSANNGYSQHLCVAIFSLCYNRDTIKKLEIIILDGGIDTTNKNIIYNTCNKYSFVSISFIAIDQTKYKDFPNINYLGLETYYRLDIPNLLPDHTRCLYLDADMVIDKDISPIFDYYREEYALGAIIDTQGSTIYKDSDLIKGRKKYIQGGVLLCNLEKLREINFTPKAIDLIKRHKNDLIFADQDIINALLKDDRYSLPQNYNVDSRIRRSRSYQQTDLNKEQFFLARNHPIVIHYSGPHKPRNHTCVYQGSKKYFQYLFMTPYGKNLDRKVKPLQRYIQKLLYFLNTKVALLLPNKIYNQLLTYKKNIFKK